MYKIEHLIQRFGAIFLVYLATSLCSHGEDRFSFWGYPGADKDPKYLPLRIELDEMAIYFAPITSHVANGNVFFCYHGTVRVTTANVGKSATVENLMLDIDASPALQVCVGRNKGIETIFFEKRRLATLTRQAYDAAGNHGKFPDSITISVTVQLYAVSEREKTFVPTKILTSEPIVIHLLGDELRVVGYYADGFLGGKFGLQRPIRAHE